MGRKKKKATKGEMKRDRQVEKQAIILKKLIIREQVGFWKEKKQVR